MELKTYVFLYRREGSLKRIPASQWRDFLDSKISLPHIHSPEFKTTEIQIFTQNHKPKVLHSIKVWDIGVDLYGFIENAHCKDLPKPKLSIPLGDLFLPNGFHRNQFTPRTKRIAEEVQLAAYLEVLFIERPLENYPVHRPAVNEVERFVEQLCMA